jgi:hypothetical protein
VAQVGRQREAERAAAGFGVTGSEPALAQEAQLVLRHRSLQAEQQPVVHQARVVNPIGIDDQRARQAAEINQMMPVPAVARQPRRLDAVDRTDGAGAKLADQALEARTGRKTGTRPPEIVIDDGDGFEAGGAGSIGQSVLALLALQVAEHLRHRRLAYVDDGATRQMVSGDLGAHREPPRSGPPVLY